MINYYCRLHILARLIKFPNLYCCYRALFSIKNSCIKHEGHAQILNMGSAIIKLYYEREQVSKQERISMKYFSYPEGPTNGPSTNQRI